MLPKQHRITKDKEFALVFDQGKSFATKFLVMKAVPNNGSVSRFGFIVSTKVSKKAYQRAKIKKWLRESAREFLKQNADVFFDTVVVARKESIDANFQFVREDFKFLISKTIRFYEKNNNKSN